MRTTPHTRRLLLVGTTTLAGLLTSAPGMAPASASLISMAGTLSGTASVDDPPENQPADRQRSVSLGFDAPGPTTLTVTSPAGSDDEETVIQQSFSASAEGFTVGGSSDSADNRSGFATRGVMSVQVVFAFDEALLYAFSFTKNNDPGEAISAQLVASDGTTPVFSFNNMGDGGEVTLVEEITFNPGVTYTLTANFESSAGGASGSAQSTTTYLIGLTLVPEPATGLLLGLGVFVVGRRRLRRR